MTQSRGVVIASRVLAALFWLGLFGYVARTSVFTVAQSELALVYRFGAFARLAPPGMHYAWPAPIERIERVPTETLRMAIGFDPIERRMNLLPTEDQSQWLTGDTNIVDLQAIVNYSLQDPRKSLATMNEPLPIVAVTDFRLRPQVVLRAVEAAFTEIASGMSIDEMISGGKAQLQIAALARAQRFLDLLDSGILLAQINVTDSNPPAGARDAFTDVQSAKADRETRISEADGVRRKAIPDSEAQAVRLTQNATAYAAKTVSVANGEANRFKTLLEEVAKNRDLAKRRLWLDAMGRVLAKGEKIFYEPAHDGSTVTVRVWLEK